MDRFGILPVRLISSIIMIIGFAAMMFVEEQELLVWVAWPCISTAGIANLMARVLIKISLIKKSILEKKIIGWLS